MTSSFEEAFHQLDDDFDGVITIKDLERYVKERNLTDKFIKKWLNLFADKNNVIYYDDFCSVLGIVAKRAKFQTKTYQVDMEEERKRSIVRIADNLLKNDDDGSASLNSIAQINKDIEAEFGGTWKVILNPDNDKLKPQYGENGLVYFTTNANLDKPKLLIYRVPEEWELTADIDENDINVNVTADLDMDGSRKNKKDSKDDDYSKNRNTGEDGRGDINLTLDYDHDGNSVIDSRNRNKSDTNSDGDKKVSVLDCDMTARTKDAIIKLIPDNISDENDLKDVKNLVESNLGGKWQVIGDPTDAEIKQPHGQDGMMVFTQNGQDEPKFLIFRELDGVNYPCRIMFADMTAGTQTGILQMVSGMIAKKKQDEASFKEALEEKLELKYGGSKWQVIVDADAQQFQDAKYDPDGLLYYLLHYHDGTLKHLLIHKRQSEEKDGQVVVLNADMSDNVKKGVVNLVKGNVDLSADKQINSDLIVKQLNELYGETWNVLVDPTEKDLKVKYDFDGQIYLIPNSNVDTKLLIWRKDKAKARGCMCCC